MNKFYKNSTFERDKREAFAVISREFVMIECVHCVVLRNVFYKWTPMTLMEIGLFLTAC
jgi:hypothetical protein